MAKLHSYQRQCLKHFLERPELPLFLKPGLGKTIISLKGLEGLLLLGLSKKNLVIAPKMTAKNTWQQEAEKWGMKNLTLSLVLGSQKERLEALEKQADVYVINVENIIWLVEHFLVDWPFDCIVIDEISKFKNPSAKRFRALRQVRPKIMRLIGLTGTPASKGLIDLWAQMYLIDRGERLEKRVTHYQQKYFYPAFGSGHIVYKWGLKDGAEQQIREKISDIAVSMGTEYLDLPPRTDNVIKTEFDGKNKKLYKNFVNDRVLELGGDEAIIAKTAAILTGKLLQFTSGAVYDQNKNPHEIHTVKIDLLLDLVDELQREPIIVYYAYRHELTRIKKAIPEAEALTDNNIERFQSGEIPVLLAHPASAGHGLNLQQNCSTICWFTLPNGDLELYEQANLRVDRQGQLRPVQIHHLIISDTWDEKALQLLMDRYVDQKEFLEALKKLIMGVAA